MCFIKHLMTSWYYNFLVPEQNTSTNAQTIISLVQSKIGYKYDPIEAVYYYIFRQQMVLLQVSKVKLSNFYIQ